MKPKEQERKALDQIRKIVAGLGEGSYVGMALEGCLDDAEENIDNDWGVSMKQRWESAKKDADHFHKIANDGASEIKRLGCELKESKEDCAAYRKMYDDMTAERDRMLELASERLTQIDGLSGTLRDRDMEILVLKARLYDLLYKE